jgi:hypothetical protein
MTQQVRLGELLGDAMEEEFVDFDMTEIQQVLDNLKDISAIDLAHAELLQQQSLRAADILIEYMAKIVKTVAHLEAKVNSTRNKVSMEYKDPNGDRTTLDMKKWAGEVSPEVAEVQDRLAAAKGSKVYLERKYEILVKSHHHFKEIAMGLRKTILGYSSGTAERTPSGWE